DGQRWGNPDRALRIRAHGVQYQAHVETELLDLVRERAVRLTRAAVLHNLEADEESAPAHVADALVALLHRAQPVHEVAAHLGRARGEIFLAQNPEHGETHRGGQGIG